MAPPTSTTWGGWVLGDLADTMRVLSELLGAAADVTSIHIEVPSSSGKETIPSVTVTASSQPQLDRMKWSAANSEFDTDYICSRNRTHWAATIAGMHLVLTLEGGQG